MQRQSRTKAAAAKLAWVAVLAAFAGLAGGNASAKETASFGLFAMFKVGDLPAYRRLLTGLEADFGKQGCAVSLEGPVRKEQGDIDVRRPNRFMHLRCTRALMGDRGGRAVLSKLRRGVANLIALEGPLTLNQDAQSASPKRARSYIFKVSHYNNVDPDKRARDLSAINRTAAKRPDRYRTEGEIVVTNAVGMRRPDEVVILFYDRPEQGARFRKNNRDLLKRIGAFNKRHLIASIYYITSSVR